MTRKLTWTAVALVAVFAIVMSAAAYTNYAMACDKNAKSASASTCDKNASAASASMCDKNAKTASASMCDKNAKTASASMCDKNAKTASASGCTKDAKTASANCAGSAKTASASGCCKGMAAEAGYSKASNDGCCKAESASQQAALKNIVTDLPYAERHRVVVAGTMECGHCTYKATDKCQPLLKTTDGKVYPLLKNHLVKDMRHGETMGADATFEVSSNVKVINGIKYLDVKSFKSI